MHAHGHARVLDAILCSGKGSDDERCEGIGLGVASVNLRVWTESRESRVCVCVCVCVCDSNKTSSGENCLVLSGVVDGPLPGLLARGCRRICVRAWVSDTHRCMCLLQYERESWLLLTPVHAHVHIIIYVTFLYTHIPHALSHPRSPDPFMHGRRASESGGAVRAMQRQCGRRVRDRERWVLWGWMAETGAKQSPVCDIRVIFMCFVFLM